MIEKIGNMGSQMGQNQKKNFNKPTIPFPDKMCSIKVTASILIVTMMMTSCAAGK
jgi:hypothetical protein